MRREEGGGRREVGWRDGGMEVDGGWLGIIRDLWGFVGGL